MSSVAIPVGTKDRLGFTYAELLVRDSFLKTEAPREDVVLLLKETRHVLTEEGWCQGHYHQALIDIHGVEKDRYCIAGAIAHAHGQHDFPTGAVVKAVNRLNAVINGGSGFYGDIRAFNDRMGRTLDGILAVIDRAIDSVQADA